MKCSQNAKNKKCIAGHLATFCTKAGILAKRQKDFTVYFYADIKFEYEKCIVSISYCVVRFTREISAKCEIREVYSWPNGFHHTS